ncbi:hypothetical protein EF847_11710 [Actinobacteria bacterium YIM 96077]|uniref:Ceramidase n=1 Tax=Phytoactinopolyspora halophila TaxID=1981511 RepID=A0A329R0I4_9ACTN|nr:ceramidase domain-containing protein [Phytoactinopolyspora halophila]AYY13264.1 hypothetical protein EF847_11710 [Actinobacteria bacterium YIM 96077]RAW17499.1 hypothetical protein DPM12_05710 [Phytoactinopolyspora halophila]
MVDRPAESDCEAFGDGFLGQAANTTTSLAFVAAGVAILLASRASHRSRTIYAVLAIGTGAGSVVFHGPAPSWAEPVHDLPLIALFAFVAADAVSDLRGRPLSPAWWVLPPLVIVALAETTRIDSAPLEAVVAAAALVASVLRMRARPEHRQTILLAMLILGAGALIGTLSRTGGPWCEPDSLLQGHAIWHVLAAVAVWRLAPAIGQA